MIDVANALLLVEKLIRATGQEPLLPQLAGIRLKACGDGDYELLPDPAAPSAIAAGSGGDLSAPDLDGAEISAVLHVARGRLNSLKVFRGDGAAIQRVLTAEDFTYWTWEGEGPWSRAMR
ncbi:hypothetical protein OH146_00200 [Salinibacterium sp. SYSU T00001]|uniref:hypothetical protein n=1 Tax=Homoserinimonas sedimenticola TaxID=2986805 RepID=UPI00223623DA|nr:hypothetical protein [Salinibacterium sedimenticola]MCW4384191.1 hypothetical protein [Salinibacterium sedimenticola]